MEFGLYRFFESAGAKLRRCKHSRQGSEAMRVFWCAIVCLVGLSFRDVLAAARAVVPGLREIVVIGHSLDSQAKGGAVFLLSLRLAALH